MSTPLVGPDGKDYAFDGTPEQLAAAKAQGFKMADDISPVDSALDSTRAAGLGLLQGVTAGLFGAGVGAQQGEEEPASSARARWVTASEINRQHEENPLASGAGELAGMLVSPLNKLAPAIEGARATSLVGRIGQKVLGGAAVGSLYGAGNVVSDAALGDTQLTAEKLIAGAGLGALLGGLGGGVGGAIEEGAAKVLPKLATVAKGGQSALDEVADHATLKAFRNTKSEMSRFTDQQLEDAVRVTRERGHLAMSPEKMAESIGADVQATGATKGGFIDALDAAGSKPDVGATLQALDAHATALPPLERETLAGPLREARTALEDLATRPQGATWRDLDKWKQGLQSKAKWLGVSSDDSMLMKGKRALAGLAREELDRQIVPALGTEGPKFLESKATYGALKTAHALAAKGAKRPGGFSLTDIASAVLGGGYHPLGIVAGLGTKLLREHGAAIVAQIADRLTKSAAMSTVAQSFAAALPATAPKLGQYAPALMAAAARSPAHALAEHMVLAQVEPSYAAAAQLAGLTPEPPDQHHAALAKATDIAAIHAATKAHDEAIHEGITHIIRGTKPAASSAVLKTQDFGAKQLRKDSQTAHTKRVEEVRRLATDPNALVERVAANTRQLGAAPAVTAHMTAIADRAVKYLAAQAEGPPKPGPLARERTPTDAERYKFSRQLEAIQEPMSLLRRAADGTLTRAQVNAVAAVYPQFLSHLRDAALEHALGGEAIPYRARVMLGILAGVDLDGTMSPKAIAANQSAIAKSASQSSEKPQDIGGGKEMGNAGRWATPEQKNQLQRGES